MILEVWNPDNQLVRNEVVDTLDEGLGIAHQDITYWCEMMYEDDYKPDTVMIEPVAPANETCREYQALHDNKNTYWRVRCQ